MVIGATNAQSEDLDEALTRSGRFDKLVHVSLPDVVGRLELLNLYANRTVANVTVMADDVDLQALARGTIGMSGADLSNLVNQASIQASLEDLPAITNKNLEWAKDKLLMGAERKSKVVLDGGKSSNVTAYHEAGHALVAMKTDGADPIHVATILPRGSSLGHVMQLPEFDYDNRSLKQLRAKLDVLVAGRVGEELVFGGESVSTGASSDIKQVSSLARAMVTKYGMSDAVGFLYYDEKSGSNSRDSADLIEREVRRFIDESYVRVTKLLKKYSKEHKRLATALFERETLTGKECIEIVDSKNAKSPRKDNDDGNSKVT